MPLVSKLDLPEGGMSLRRVFVQLDRLQSRPSCQRHRLARRQSAPTPSAISKRVGETGVGGRKARVFCDGLLKIILGLGKAVFGARVPEEAASQVVIVGSRIHGVRTREAHLLVRCQLGLN